MLGVTTINIPAWGDATLIELVWLSAGLATLAFTLGHLRDLIDDWQVARDTHRPVLSQLAFDYVRRELTRLANGLIILGVGVWAITEPPALPGPARTTVTGLVVTAALVGLAFTSAISSWWDWDSREKVQRLIGQGKNGGPK